MKTKIIFFLAIIPVSYLWVLVTLASGEKPVDYTEIVKDLWTLGLNV